MPRGLLALTTTGFLVAALGDGGRRLSAAVDAANDLVPADLAGVCTDLRDGDAPFFGTAVVARLEATLRLLPPTAPRAETLFALGNELFRVGRTGEALVRLNDAVAAAAEEGLPAERRLLFVRLLALAHLRAGEDANCIARHTASSCIFPIAGEGVHADPTGVRRAADLYMELLTQRPGDATLRWLLNMARMASGDWPAGVPLEHRLPAELLERSRPFQRWRDIGPDLGVAVRDLAGGAVMDDFDGDGLLDVVTSTWDPCDGMKAFRNDGRGGLVDVSREWGLAGQRGSLYMVQADYDGDGMLDLLLLRGAWMGDFGRLRKSLLRNDLRRIGRFADVTVEAGVALPAYPTQAAGWADYDNDGDLDLYVGGEASTSGEPFAAQLFRNAGDGTFVDVAAQAGVENRRFAKGVAWGDYDDDGDPDLYVSNIGPNRLYRNQGDGTFVDVAESLGVTEPVGRSFSTWFFDYDNDGDLDLFVADYSSSVESVFASYFGPVGPAGRPLLYRNDSGRFREVGAELGITRPALPMGSNYGDLDNDGWLDFYLGTGVPDYEALDPNQMYRNVEGRAFEDVTFAGGFGHLQKGHAVAFGDLDNDGDQDLLEQMGGAFPFDAYANALYENPGSPAAWLTLRLEGSRRNRFAVGARVEVIVEGTVGRRRRSIHLLVGSGSSFGGNSLQQEVGLGAAERIDTVRVRWPGGGKLQTFRGLLPRHAYRLREGQAHAEPLALPRIRLEGNTAGHHH